MSVKFRAGEQVDEQVTPQVVAVLNAAGNGPKSREELQRAAGIKDREHFRKAYLEPLISAGRMERTIPGKPNSRYQKYRTSKKGMRLLARQAGS